MADSLIGRSVAQYRVVAELGRGQYSVVYKAWQQSLERYVALKVLRDRDEGALQKFRAESRLIAHLIQQGVPNVRQLYEVGLTPDGHVFVALEYVDDSLRNILRRSKARGRRANPAMAARLLKPVADALDAMHSLGWVHLDIKPQNILISKQGQTLLADFGIARRKGMKTHACTPTYASPEQAAGDRPVGPWSDIYALGVVLYEMVAGHPPVRGDHDIVLLNQHLEAEPRSPRRVNPEVSPRQERALMKALAKAPRKRQRTAGELIQDMQQPEEKATGRIRRPPRIALVGAALGLLTLILFLAAWVVWTNLPSAGPEATIVVTDTRLPAFQTEVPTAVSATPTPTVRLTPTNTPVPTETLAPTRTPRPRPTATRTRSPTPLPSAAPTSGP